MPIDVPPPVPQTAIVAGGCFWCIEHSIAHHKGVLKAVSGYTGGHVKNPTYEQIGTGKTGHYEAVKVVFDPKVISYRELLDYYFKLFDPTDPDGSFADRGPQYRSAIFYLNETQKKAAIEAKTAVDRSGKFPRKVVTAILPAGQFYDAEAYHQDYGDRNPLHYQMYKKGSGREKFQKDHWP